MSFVAGDIQIKELTLRSLDGCRSYNLLQQAKVINIYESILSPIIYAEIAILDGIGLHNDFPILCEEVVDLVFTTPGTSCETKYSLFVNKVVDKKISTTNKAEEYVLSCVSQECTVNAGVLYNRKFKQEVSTSIKEIFDSSLKREKELTWVEPTRGIEEVIISNMQPFKAIDLLRQRATSKSFISSSFVFFEYNKGFQFTTIEGLFERNRKSIGDKIFFYDKQPNIDSSKVTIRNIIAHQQVSYGSTISKLNSGAFTNVVNRLDLFTGKYTAMPYTIDEAADKFQMADGQGAAGTNTSTFITEKKKASAKNIIVPTSSEKADTQIPEKLAVLQSFVELISSDLVRIYVYGDSAITVGDVIECKFPEVTGLTKNPTTDRIHSGNYMVSCLRHIIVLGDRYNHTMSMELIKGNYLST